MKILVPMCVAAVALATPALAQREFYAAQANPFDKNIVDAVGFKNDLRPSTAEKRLALESDLRAFAQCAVGAEPQRARELLAVDPASKEQAVLLKSIAYARDGCSGTARARDGYMRGVLAEQIYLRDFPTAIAATAQPTAAFAPSRSGDLALYDYASCVVSRNAAGADAVLRADPRSEGEKSAYAGIMPTLSSCMAGSATVRMDRTALRGYLAEALYSHRQG